MAILQTRCPTCRQKFGSTKGFSVGRVIHCPKCDADFTVTDPNAPTLPTQATAATVAASRPAKPTAATKTPAGPTQPSAMAKPAAPAKPTPLEPAPLPLSLDDEPAAVKPNLVPLSLDDDPPPPRKRGPVKIAIVGLVLIALGVGGFVGIGKFLQGPREHDTAGKDKHPGDATSPDDPITPPPPPEPEPEPLPPYDGPFPRRLLFIHISKYQYLNPLTNAASGATDQTRASALALAARWKIPADKEHDQVFLLSDTATGSEARVPVKEVVRGSYERFFDTSRPQDHIVVYFGGHAVEWNGKAYFAPIDGEFDEPTSLIPVDEIYAKLRACKATEKVVIWDVCRFNPQRGRLRPGSEPMSPSLAKLLAAAPSDIEVMTTCKAGENALEFSASPVQSPGGPMFSGSLFLEAFKLAGDQMLKSPRNPQPTDAIPLAKWAPVITKHAGELAKVSPGGGTQTITIAGKTPSKRVAFNAADPLAKRFEIPEAPKKTGPPPTSADVDAIVREFSVPAVKLFGTDVPPPVFRDRPDALTGYKADVTIDEIMKNREKYQFRVTVIEAFDAVRSLWRTSGKGSLRVMDTFSGPVGNNLKRNVKKDQDSWAVSIAVLESFNDRLDSQMKERALQPKRWQAHYDYARALVKSRLAYLNEYNKMLGDILTETLPSLDEKQKQDGYKLVSTETAKMKSKKDIKQLATEAAELYDQIIAERRGTPWADQARRDRLTPLGMAWHPYASKP